MKRFAVVFDASPVNSPTPWMVKACRDAELFLVNLDEVAKEMAADPEARKALQGVQSPNQDASIGRFYLAALEKVAEGKGRIAVNSVTWIRHGLEPDAVVISFDQMQDERARAKTLGFTDESYDFQVEAAKNAVRGYLKDVPPERLKEVSGDDAAKSRAAVEFIRQRG